MGNITPEAWLISTGVSYGTITLALAAASAEDTILISDGIFSEDITLANSQTIVGQGKQRSIIYGKVTMPASGGKLQSLTVSNDADVCISIPDNCFFPYFEDVEINAIDRTYDGISVASLANGMQNLVIIRCEIRNCLNGIYLEHGEITNTYELSVIDSEFANCTKGIYIYAGVSPTTTYIRTSTTIVQDSRFFDCDTGITLGDGLNPDIRMTRLTMIKNSTGFNANISTDFGDTYVIELIDSIISYTTISAIAIGGGGTNNTLRGYFVNNEIFGSGNYDFNAGTNVSVDAEYNWWGTASPVGGQFNGTVDYTPFLSHPTAVINNSNQLGVDGVIVNSYTTGGKAEVQAECEDALAAYDPPTDTEMVAAFTEIKGATWSSGSDTLEHIRDKQTDIETDTQSLQGGLTVDIDLDSMYIATGTTAVNDVSTMLQAATSVTVDNTTNFESVGVFQVESELVTYTGKTLTTFTGLGRGAYGTSDATHADNTAIYGANVFRAKLSMRDATNTAEAPDSAPTLTIVDIDGNSELTETNMTQDGSLVGVYYHNFAILSSQSEEKWEFKFKVIDNSLTNYIYKERFITSQPARRSDAYGGDGELYCYEDGYINSSGTFTAWDDDYEGDVTNSETGVAIDDATVTAYRVEDGVTIPDMHPPGQTKTKVDGSWRMFLDAGTYTFTVRKYAIIDESFNRTIS